jgi:hypothetical protein
MLLAFGVNLCGLGRILSRVYIGDGRPLRERLARRVELDERGVSTDESGRHPLCMV